ncbi:uncharacterized protein LOC107495233 [Arachis duranensis]|uniref:Uncharacterized protein LOC107495233 n=1 Tax=Arachis duranensis TaxID=130453 RepID=A0A6P4DPN8_ARADU|nr:uncharacterized protein LOC107495233 [Arachis duranensis]
MSPLHHLFSSLSTTTNALSTYIANGSLLHATHKGSISQSTLNLHDTYYIPKLNFNLISVGQLVDLDFDVNFFISDCRVQDRRMGQIIGIGCKVRRLFELENLHIPPVPNLCDASAPSTIHLWHHRLAHSSLGKLRPLVSYEYGTLPEFSCPGTSQQKGRGEYKHYHILDSVRAILLSSSCPK